MTATLLAFLAFFLLSLVLRLPVGLSLGAVGIAGLWIMRGSSAAVFSGATEIFEATGYALSVVPMFVLMGNFVTRGGLSRQLYQAAYAFLGHRRGGLATSTIVACAGFGAVCGSAVATVATMAKVAVPEMRRFGYSDSLAAATVGAGGTLGILIPPSALMILYGLMTETSIGALFAAGMVPGIVAMGFYVAASNWTVWRDPSAGPHGERTPWSGRARALVNVWPVLLLFGLVIGGMYGGVFTATEAAGIGAAGGYLIAWGRKTLTWDELRTILVDSAVTTGMLFTILIGAMIFANFVAFTSMTNDLMALVKTLDVAPIWIVAAIVVIYLVLGTAMEEFSMILLTLPVFFPLVTGLGFDPVWFGILVVCVVEIGLISPPVGMNLFVLRAQLPEVPISAIWRGLVPFLVADVARLALLVALPVISLWLPRTLGLMR
ncbi:MAG: C4-dicarboxylate transporter permease [Ramlibacter sp.]|jgi:tripartite ATP-independent transporter DctM subunit|nr:C4-dicarboxylate transporter permease [Ramlibacter sp.]MDF2462226.1 C4-dicarboxylate transporter permease [Ramlibacter sp.]